MVFFELFIMSLLLTPQFKQYSGMQGCFFLQTTGCARHRLHTKSTNETKETTMDFGWLSIKLLVNDHRRLILLAD
jgi:hypothetical protein